MLKLRRFTYTDRIRLERQGPQVERVSATLIHCSVHAHTGGDVPASTELHHVFPLELQKIIWPDVDRDHSATIRDKERVPLCGNAHSDVHLAIEAILQNTRMPAGVGRLERKVAVEGVSRYLAARKA